jgi:hypothetical protein
MNSNNKIGSFLNIIKNCLFLISIDMDLNMALSSRFRLDKAFLKLSFIMLLIQSVLVIK